MDEWNETLRCPKCGKTGRAILSQDDDDETLTVQRVSDGFKVVDNRYGRNFSCKTCDIAAMP